MTTKPNKNLIIKPINSQFKATVTFIDLNSDFDNPQTLYLPEEQIEERLYFANLHNVFEFDIMITAYYTVRLSSPCNKYIYI